MYNLTMSNNIQHTKSEIKVMTAAENQRSPKNSKMDILRLGTAPPKH